MSRNKRSIILELKTRDGVALARGLAAESDVAMENFRPGVADRLGIGFADLKATNDRLVLQAILGFGAQA